VPDEADEEGSGEPPHPLDRVWFHPSELSGFIAAAPARLGGREWSLAGVAALLGAVLTVVALAVAGAFDDGSDSATLPRLTVVGGGTADVAEIVEQAAPSIVAVHGVNAFGVVTGSGVSIGRSQVLTSATLLNGATPMVTVTTPDGRVLDAMVAGLDPETDLALLTVQTRQGRDLTPAELGSTESLVVGQSVVAFGMTGGDHRWASPGVVSALDRLATTPAGVTMAGLVEIDVEPAERVGGGALLDAGGAVIGILSRSAPGHALPIDVASDIADQLATNGRARHGWLGLDAEDAGDRDGGGARVTAVVPGGPADTAGIAVGDVIVVVGTDDISDASDLAAAISRRRPTDPVDVTLWRGTKRVRRDVDLGESIPTPASPPAA